MKRKSQIDAENSASSKDFPRSSTLGLPEEPNTSTRVLLPSSAGSGNIQVPAASNGQIGLEISKEESASIQISELSYFLGLSPYPLIPGVSTEVVRKAVLALHSDTKVATRRSNFFKSLIGYDRVTAVGLRPLGDSIEVRTIETTVERQDFKKFVMLSDKLPAEIIEDAVIEIVAPVLKQGNVKWKGMYQDQAISFAMADNDFKDMVLRRVVSFGSGDSIRAILNIEKKVDGLGEEVITGYAVSVVTAKIDSNGEQPTQAGRRHKFNSKQTNSQKGLFDAPVSDRDEFPSEDWGSW
ncbi:hypothetical protein ACFJIS_04820 [Variovorax boronicumulans]|uniref:hypothetical protein n=1 Tax=Variovorax boronicumulans TaxID=436515 RepID=UPI0036F2E7EA